MTADDSRIASILGAWQEQLDRGEDVDPERVISQHPDLAPELRGQFQALSQMRHAQATKQARTTLRKLPIDRYGEFKPAGEGGMGIVYWAIDTDLNREVAFKIIRAGRPEDLATAPDHPIELTPPSKDTPASRSFETLKQRFLQEAWITSGMAHPGIVPVYELGETTEGVPYYTMRFIKGERTLATVIEEVKTQSIDERLALLEPFLKVCDTLRYAHSRGVIHRDLKPENIAIGEFGEVVLIDWGLAKLKGSPELEHDRLQIHVQAYRDATDLKTVAGAMGTPGYMGPEAALCKSDEMDERSDVYSLGVMLFEILTGRLPFEFTTFGELAGQLLKKDAPRAIDVDPSVPEALSNLCARCLAREMTQRPPRVDVLSEAIRAWQQESAARKEVRALLREADEAMSGTAGLTGEALLRQLDRVTALSRRVLQMRQGHGRARRLLHDCEEIRSEAIAERETTIREAERKTKTRLLFRVAAAAVLVLLVGTAVSALLLDRERREAEDAKGRTTIALARMEEERNAKSKLLEEVQAERDAKKSALAEVQAESEAKQRALARVEAERDAKDAALARIQAAHDAKTEALKRLQAEQEAREAAEAEVVTERGAKLEEVRRKRALELVNASIAAQQEDAMRSLLLAREAGRIQMLPEVVTRLHSAIGASYERAEFRGHEDAVFSAALSPTGDRVLTASRDGTARLWKADGEPATILRGHKGPVHAAAFSPDGKHIVTASADGTARLWSEDGTPLATLEGHAKDVIAVSWSPAGRHIVTASQDRTARLWSLAGKETAVLEGHKGPLCSASFSPRGDLILTSSQDGTARTWNVNGGSRRTLSRHRGAVTAAAFSPSGNRILTGSADGTARLWDLKGKSIQVLRGHDGALTTAAFSPMTDRLLTASVDGTARLWNTEGKELARMTGHGAAVIALALSPSGRRIVTASEDKTVRVWDEEGEQLRVYRGHDGAVHSVAFASSPDRILTASSDGTARLWSLDGGEVALWKLHGTEAEAPPSTNAAPSGDRGTAAPASQIRWAGAQVARMDCPEGEQPLVGFTDKGRKVFAVTATKVASSFGVGTALEHRLQHFDLRGGVTFNKGFAQYVAKGFSPTGERWVIGEGLSGMGILQLMTATTTSLNTMGGRRVKLGGNLSSVTFSDTGSYMLAFETVRSDAGSWLYARVWGRDGRPVGKARLDANELQFVALSPTGGEFFAVSSEGAGHLWNVRRKRKVARIPNVGLVVRWCGFSPSGSHILVIEKNHVPRLLSVDGESDITLEGHRGDLWMAAFSPAGDRIVTAGSDHTARLWDLEGNQLAVFRGHRAAVRHAAFSRQGDRIITGSDDQTARVWDLQGNARGVIRGPTASVTYAMFAPDDETLLTLSGNVIRLWRLEAETVDEPLATPTLSSRAAVSPSEDRVVSCSGEPTPHLWSLGGLPSNLTGHVREVDDAVFSTDGRSILTVARSGTVRQWDRTGEPELAQDFPAVRLRRDGPVRIAGFLDGENHILMQIFGSAWIWEFPRGHAIELRDPRGTVLSAALSSDRTRVLTTSTCGTATLWAASGTRTDRLGKHGGPVQTGAFSPSGEYIATASGNHLHLWTSKAKPLAKGVGHEGAIHTVVFSSAGDLVLTASADGTARVWDIHGNERAVLRGHDWDVLSAVFSPASDRILTASKDKTARLWDLQGNELAILRGHDSWVGQALFMEEGRRILTTSEDGTARVWLAGERDLLELAETRIVRDFTPDEQARYAELLQSSERKR